MLWLATQPVSRLHPCHRGTPAFCPLALFCATGPSKPHPLQEPGPALLLWTTLDMLSIPRDLSKGLSEVEQVWAAPSEVALAVGMAPPDLQHLPPLSFVQGLPQPLPVLGIPLPSWLTPVILRSHVNTASSGALPAPFFLKTLPQLCPTPTCVTGTVHLPARLRTPRGPRGGLLLTTHPAGAAPEKRPQAQRSSSSRG